VKVKEKAKWRKFKVSIKVGFYYRESFTIVLCSTQFFTKMFHMHKTYVSLMEDVL